MSSRTQSRPPRRLLSVSPGTENRRAHRSSRRGRGRYRGHTERGELMEAGSVPSREPTGGETARAAWTPADPGPLGLAGFAMSTFVPSLFNSQLVAAGGG